MAETAEEKDDKGKPENLTGEWLGDHEARNFAVEGNDLSGYIGVSPEYMTYADETQMPYSTDEEVLSPAEQLMFEEDDEDDESDEKSSTTQKSTASEQPKTEAKPSTSTGSNSSAKATASTASKSTTAK